MTNCKHNTKKIYILLKQTKLDYNHQNGFNPSKYAQFNLNYFIFQTWDDGLAKIAKAWANKCTFKHNSCLSKSYGCHPTFQFVGENIWLGGLSIFSPHFAVVAWFNETEFYDYDTLSCSKACGHYTQVNI